MIIDTDLSQYIKLKEYLSQLYPNIKLALISSDVAIKKLGFVEKTPCTIEVEINENQCSEIADKAFELETMIYNSSHEEPSDNPYYDLYLKYDWLYCFLCT